MVSAGNKANGFLSVNHTTKAVHDHHIYTYRERDIYNKAHDGEKVNLFYLKSKIFILIIYKINI